MDTPSQPPPSLAHKTAPDGAHPAKQARSRQLRDRLIACGRTLVEQGGFAGTSMADIARAAGCSVGALYVRFRDKDALFDCVAEVAMAQSLEAIRARAAAGRYRQPTLADTIAAVVEDYADYVANNQGMIRALYQRAMQDAHYWTIVRNAGNEMVSIWTSAIAASAGCATDAAFIKQARIALRYVTGVLVYSSLLVEPPSYPLSPQEQLHWLAEMARHIISAPPMPPTDAVSNFDKAAAATAAAVRARPKSRRSSGKA